MDNYSPPNLIFSFVSLDKMKLAIIDDVGVFTTGTAFTLRQRYSKALLSGLFSGKG